MRRIFILVFVFITVHVSAQNSNKHPYRPIRTIITDLNNDNKPDTITLISSLEGRNDFNKIAISLAGYGKTVFKARDYWTEVDSDFLVNNKNAYHTKLLFLKKTDKHAVILLFGEIDGAGYRGEFSIINIENNHVAMPFDQFNTNSDNNELDIEIPETLTDLKHDGRLDFVYRDYGELYAFDTKLNADIGTYHPYFVYKADDKCELDDALTKAYNDKYYVYAGSGSGGEIKILYPRNGGKPRVYKK